MDLSFFTGFITLTALIITSGILTIASLTYANTIGATLFEKIPSTREGHQRYKHVSEEMQKLRGRICKYPKIIFTIYSFGLLIPAIVLAYHITFLQNGNDFVIASYGISLETLMTFHHAVKNFALPGCISFYISYSLFIVWYHTNIAHVYYRYMSES